MQLTAPLLFDSGRGFFMRKILPVDFQKIETGQNSIEDLKMIQR